MEQGGATSTGELNDETSIQSLRWTALYRQALLRSVLTMWCLNRVMIAIAIAIAIDCDILYPLSRRTLKQEA